METKKNPNISKIVNGLKYLNNCLMNNNDAERRVIQKLIRKGRKFIAYPQADGYIFGPIMFLLGIDNNILDYKISHKIDGGVNNLFKSTLGFHFNKELKNEFEKFCDKFSINIKGIDVDIKEYSVLEVAEKSFINKEGTENFDFTDVDEAQLSKDTSEEGRRCFRQHWGRERSSGWREKLLNNRRTPEGELHCEICGWFSDAMENNMHESMFEAHHIIPLARGEAITDLSKLALLCACCHRLIHRVMGKNALDKLVGIEEMRDKYGKSLYCGKG